MTDDELWDVERGLWTRGRAHYERWFSPDCVCAFPEPTGVMVGDAFVADLPDGGGWQSVELTEQAVRRPAAGIAVLGYRGTRRRPDETYASICTSTYAEGDDGRWRLVQHQQTPVAG